MSVSAMLPKVLRIGLAALWFAALVAPAHAHAAADAGTQGWQLAGQTGGFECSLCSMPAPAKLAAASQDTHAAPRRTAHVHAVELGHTDAAATATRSRAPPHVR